MLYSETISTLLYFKKSEKKFNKIRKHCVSFLNIFTKAKVISVITDFF